MDVAAYLRRQEDHLGQEARSVKDFSVAPGLPQVRPARPHAGVSAAPGRSQAAPQHYWRGVPEYDT